MENDDIPKEIEYKFLINEAYTDMVYSLIKNIEAQKITQGYLNSEKDVTILPISKNNHYYLSISCSRLSSLNYEYEIPEKDFHGIIYLFTNTPKEHLVIRVRIKNEKSFLTIKGPSVGIARPEYEYPINFTEADHLIKLCQEVVIKERFAVPAENMLFWEIDFFKELNEGLILVELEVPSKDTLFEKPIWLGEDVSLDFKYVNSNLAISPYTLWSKSIKLPMDFK